MPSAAHPPRAVIFGCAGTALRDAERTFFRSAEPLGFILFRRNCQSPQQIGALVAALRDTIERPDAPILIDQEGGRVARLTPPHWHAAPAAARLGALAMDDPARAAEATHASYRLIASDLYALGISVDCAPVMDVARPETTQAIGDRAFSDDPELVALLGAAACAGLLAGGILPVIKHMPGHGRATVDSHLALPRVSAGFPALRDSDFRPFAAAAGMPWGMTAHVVYEALDLTLPATQSPTVIDSVIRGEIGFAGFLVSDDICMEALAGDSGERAARALAAGCDTVLHCNGDLGAMQRVAAAVPPLSDAACERLARAAARRQEPAPIDAAAMRERLKSWLSEG